MVVLRLSEINFIIEDINNISELEKACIEFVKNFKTDAKGDFLMSKNGHYQITARGAASINKISKRDYSARILGVEENKIDVRTGYGDYTINF